MRKIGEALDGISCIVAGTVLFVLSARPEYSWLWSFPAWGAFGVGFFKLRDLIRSLQPVRLDPRTGRPLADHGEGHHAVQFSLEQIDDHWERSEFLTSWMHGGAWEHWPEFYPWLKEREQ